MASANNTDDPTWTLLILVTIFGGIGWVIWHFFNQPLMEFVRYVKLVEIAPLALVDRQASSCFMWLREAHGGDLMPSHEAYQAALGCFGSAALARLPANEALQYYNMTPTSLGFVGAFVGSYIKWPVAVFCGFVAYYAIFKSVRNEYKKRHNLESFIKTQSSIWKVIAPIVSFNPSKHSARVLGGRVPQKLPLFAEALAPEEWLSFHQIPIVKGIPRREEVHRALSLQLGPRWTENYQELPLYIQALLAAFALKGVQKRDESDDLLGRISACWSESKGMSFPSEMVSEIKKILKDSAIGGEVLNVAKNHAFRTTAVIGVLKWARFMGGVLAAAQFLWLRGVDRDLWYALNNLGRRSFHTEGAGAMAHFMAEDLAHKALVVPRFETVFITLNKYMGDNQVTVPPYEGKSRA
ncbi:MAG: hypothetical protein WC612_01480 [Bdellovibrionales bacterium]|jgi:intracellular multiplication protein IcmP